MMLPETKDGPVCHVIRTFYDHIQCPQQPEDYECCYYVMKWMYDITFYYCKAAEIQFEQNIATSSMSMIDMNVAREVWANKCLDNMNLV
ncbi:uncharacterized protein LOC141626412 isoform X1 [Silene latifolia]|uniref:uncharacterized protein LOC141626412 isoform X1 n=1 Tax=Silene latifolia TaxID=37657 RepID=UPI003D76E690